MNEHSLMRRGLTAGAIGALAVTVGGVGVATAANGGSLTLGRSNIATHTTTLKDSKGTPLSLVGDSTKPPLRVSSSKQVAHLNASLLGGQSASALASSGSAGQMSFGQDGIPLGTSGSNTTVAATQTLSPGVYYVTASAQLLDTSAGTGYCWVSPKTEPNDMLQVSGVYVDNRSEAVETFAVTLLKPTALAEGCYLSGNGAEAQNAGIVAIRIAHPTGKPLTAG